MFAEMARVKLILGTVNFNFVQVFVSSLNIGRNLQADARC